MPLSDDQRNLLARVITDSLQGTIRLSIWEIPKLVDAAKQVGASKEHVLQGLRDWLTKDPLAQELVREAFRRAGMVFGTPSTPSTP